MSAPALPDAAFGRLPSVALPSLPDPLAAVQAILDAIMSIVRGIIQSIIKPLLDPIMGIIQSVAGAGIKAVLMGGEVRAGATLTCHGEPAIGVSVFPCTSVTTVAKG